ncbi:MAG: transposase [Deltaproteobacteria bacterium]|nr:transposase [Deltaproteobacteria bacterium]
MGEYYRWRKLFIKGLQEQFPNTVLTFDQFHVIKLMSDVLDKTHYLFLESPDRLTGEQERRLRSLLTLTRFDLGRSKAYGLYPQAEPAIRLQRIEPSGI